MIGTLMEEIAASPPRETQALIRLLNAVLNEKEYHSIIKTTFEYLPEFKKREGLLKGGHFLGHDLVLLMHAYSDGAGTTLEAVGALLEQMIKWRLVSDASVVSPNRSLQYQWNTPRIARFTTLQILDNALLGATYVVEKYRESVLPLFVRKGKDEHTGTGFLSVSPKDGGSLLIVTAKHNVDPAEGISFIGFGAAEDAMYTPLAASWVLHPSLDIALMPVRCSKRAIAIHALGSAKALTRTITLGYPRIATTDAPYLLTHGGEVNATVTSYFGERRHIISNVVAPGNSGGPVLNEAGLWIGMVVDSLETFHDGGVAVANSAIPAELIYEFISQTL